MHEAVENLGLRDYAELLVTLGAAGFPMPTLPPEESGCEIAANFDPTPEVPYGIDIILENRN